MYCKTNRAHGTVLQEQSDWLRHHCVSDRQSVHILSNFRGHRQATGSREESTRYSIASVSRSVVHSGAGRETNAGSRRDKGFPGPAGASGYNHTWPWNNRGQNDQPAEHTIVVGAVGSPHSDPSLLTDCGRFDNLRPAMFFFFCGDCLGCCCKHLHGAGLCAGMHIHQGWWKEAF